MTKSEIDRLLFYLSNCRNYFEYGCGNSTIMASKIETIQTIAAVDSCLYWIDKASKQIDNKVIFNYIDINADETKLGLPKDKSKIKNWPTYSNIINNYNIDFDLILVDGRFRVACCLASFLKMKNDSHLLLHDYNRMEYHVLENYFQIVEQVDTLVVFKKIESIDEQIIKEKYEKFKLVMG